MPSSLHSSYQPVCPLDGQALAPYHFHTVAEGREILGRVDAAWGSWRRTSVPERLACLAAFRRGLDSVEALWTECMHREMGKLPSECRAEVEKCAWLADWYLEHTERLLADQPLPSSEGERFLVYQPLGVVLAIMPWNFPFWQAVRAIIPNLLAGNTVLLKHAPDVPGVADALEAAVAAAFPPDVFTQVRTTNAGTAELIGDHRLRGVCLTGSDRAGRAVAAQAGAHLKPVILELGGSDPYLICEDADLELALKECVHGRMRNNGQSCIATKRLIVHRTHYASFVDEVVRRGKSYRWGDPRQDPSVNQAPLARHDLRNALHQQVMRSVECGASLRLGGEIPDHPGAFYPVTVLADVVPGMPVFDDEIFGPVFAITCARDEAEMIRLANQTRFGLGAAIFSRDVDRARRIARDELLAGTCAINGRVSSDPAIPFGGIYDSGLGRELGAAGLYAFCNQKTVWIG